MVANAVLEGPQLSLNGFEKLSARLEGRIFTPGHQKYDESRQIWNALRDRRPAAIVRPASTKDVLETVRFAKGHGYLLSVRSGGHGISGGAVRDGGITIDFSQWKHVHVDPERRIAVVQPGVTWGELDTATQEFGLAVPGGKLSTVGVGGSALGGGIGWLVRKHGLTIDHLRSVEIVTGAGKLVTASESTNPDLFWGVRGAGAYLGVVTSFEFELVPVGPVVAGLVAHPFERAQEVLEFYRDYTASAPEEVTGVAALMHGPDGSKMVGIGVTYAGDPELGERVVAPIRSFGPPVMDMVGTMPYGLLQKELARMAHPGVSRAMKSAFVEDMSDDFLGCAINAFAKSPTVESTMLFEHYGGAASRISPTATAFPHRNQEYNLVVDTGWSDIGDGRDAYYWMASSWKTLRPYTRNAAYVGFLDADDIGRGVEAFGEDNFARLRELKLIHDPAHILASFPGLRQA